MSDQSRASAWHVVHWAERTRARDILVENVPEFMSWGPLNAKGRPIKARRGETFQAFCQALSSLGYRVEWRVLNSADFGDAQTRTRFFLRARANNRRIDWPSETHSQEPDLLTANRWRAAREIIDWRDRGESIFARARPMAPRTLARIREGLRRYGGDRAQPWIDLLDGKRPRRIPDAPPSPFMVPRHGERPTQSPRTHSLDAPMPTIAATNAPELVIPFILPHDQFTAKNGAFVDSVDDPLRTVTASNGGDNHLVCATAGPRLDILKRGLRPRELARAQGFPDWYEFTGNKGEQIRQIGNAWPGETAFALCSSILAGRAA